MTQITETHKTFFKELLNETIESKTAKLDVLRTRIISFREKVANLPVETASYTKSEALQGYILEYLKLYKELEKLTSSAQS
jgi:hypothetical protein